MNVNDFNDMQPVESIYISSQIAERLLWLEWWQAKQNGCRTVNIFGVYMFTDACNFIGDRTSVATKNSVYDLKI